MSELHESMAMLGFSETDVRARAPRPGRRRRRWLRRAEPEYVSPFEAKRFAEAERQAALMRGTGLQ